MPESKSSQEADRLIKTLKQGGLAFNRKEAAEQIEKLPSSSEALVAALVQAREFDENEEVRKAAAKALQAPGHRAILDRNPNLAEQPAPPEKGSQISRLGILSYACALLSLVLVYLVFFFFDPRFAAEGNPLGLTTGAASAASAVLLVGSFLLPLAGLIFGILAVRQYDRKTAFGLMGMVGNMIILLATSYAIISR